MLRSATRCLPVLSHAMLRGKAYRGTAEHGRAWQRNAWHGKEWQGVRHLLVKGLWQPLFAWICTLAGPPWANCRGMAFRGQFSHRCVRWRGLPGPPAGKWLLGAAALPFCAMVCHALPPFAMPCHALLRVSCLALLCHAVRCLAELCHASFYISPHSTAAWLSIAWLYSIAKHRRSWLFVHSIVEHIIVKRS